MFRMGNSVNNREAKCFNAIACGDDLYHMHSKRYLEILPNPHLIHTTPGVATCHNNPDAQFCNECGHKDVFLIYS